ncbi:MAG: phosphoglucomutase/phosphomannomutase family protein [Candidatus Methylomirabilales bacterium]
MQIHFGTSGWRGVIADEFTFAQVRIVIQAIADSLREDGLGRRGVVVGYDTRFLAEEFAREAVGVLAGNGIPVFWCIRDTPTPVLAYEITRRGAAGGINITASHNPPEYGGIKYSMANGGPAVPELTSRIERRANALLREPVVRTVSLDRAEASGCLRRIDPRQAYLARLGELVDLAAIQRARLTLVIDPLYGTARDYLDALCRRAGCTVSTLHDWRDPLFGGGRPEPDGETLHELTRAVREEKAHLGLATDGDADRFGVVDADGQVIPPNQILALLLSHLITARGLTGGVARSVATSHFVDAVAARHGVEVFETPVGFKYIGELLTQGKIMLGGEESAGLTIRGHVPEKDGILACLLVAETVAMGGGQSLQAMVDRLKGEVGHFLTRRIDLKLTGEERRRMLEIFEMPPRQIAGRAVRAVNRTDGMKLLLDDGSWLLLRPSGTEPLVRLYAEAPDEEGLKALEKAGREFLYG